VACCKTSGEVLPLLVLSSRLRHAGGCPIGTLDTYWWFSYCISCLLAPRLVCWDVWLAVFFCHWWPILSTWCQRFINGRSCLSVLPNKVVLRKRLIVWCPVGIVSGWWFFFRSFIPRTSMSHLSNRSLSIWV